MSETLRNSCEIRKNLEGYERKKKPFLTICVAAWNEVETLEKVVGEISGSLKKIGKDYEIVIIDDGSTDGTEKIADCLAAGDENIKVVHHNKNLGLGFVYRTGFKVAEGDYLSFFPADGQFPSSIIELFYNSIEGNDLIVGFIPERKGSKIGTFLSRMERIFYRFLFGRIPHFEGIFMIKRCVLNEIPLLIHGRGWGVVMELMLRADKMGYKIIEIPISMRPRMAGKSKVNNLRHIFINLKQLLELRFAMWKKN